MPRLGKETHGDAHTRRNNDEHGQEVDENEEEGEVGASKGAGVVLKEDIDCIKVVLTDLTFDATQSAAHLERNAAVADVGEADDDGEEPRDDDDLDRSTLALSYDCVERMNDRVIPGKYFSSTKHDESFKGKQPKEHTSPVISHTQLAHL